MNEGMITGDDPTMCACCGGLIFHFINTNDNTRKPLDNPEIFRLPLNPKFPIYVKIDWQKTNYSACGPRIKIVRFQLF